MSFGFDHLEYLKFKIIFFSVLFFFSCRKDPSINFDCEEIPSFYDNNVAGFGYSYINDTTTDIAYSVPTFSPFYSNEILLYKRLGDGTNVLNKVNIDTENEETIYTGTLNSHPKWSLKDWIIFSNEGKIWKIKSDGDSLTNLVNSSGNFYPLWNKAGDKFIAFNSNLSSSSIIYNEIGDALDTIDCPVSYSSAWLNDSLIATHRYSKLRVFDVENKKEISSYEYESDELHSGTIIPENGSHIIWSQIDGIYKSDIYFTNIEIVKPSCNSKIYVSGSLDKQKDNIVWSKLEKVLLNKSTVYLTSSIVLMDSNTGDEITLLEGN